MRMVGIALLVCAAIGLGPTVGPPPGWIFIEALLEDATAGSFHDRQTGLFVDTETRLESAREKRSWERKKPVRTRYGSREVEVRARPTGAGECQKIEVRVPAPGSMSAATFFTGVACGSQQEARFRELVGTLPVPFVGVTRPPVPSAPLTRDRIERLNIGDSWEDVGAMLGAVDDVRTSGDGGFTVSFLLGESRVVLNFDREQRLRRPLPYE
jgi:hypothetical protein